MKSMMSLGQIACVGACACAVGATMSADNSTRCLENLGKLGQATLLYAASNDDKLPPMVTYGLSWPQHGKEIPSKPVEWKAALTTVGGLEPEHFFCPAHDPKVHGEESWEGEKAATFGYRMTFIHVLGALTSGKLESWQAVDGGILNVSLSAIEHPRKAAYLEDLFFTVFTDGKPSIVTPHGRYTSRLYFDGHVAMSLRLPSKRAASGDESAQTRLNAG
jgi:prepilin-type processing-associated H-X9-DG protein